MILLMLMIILLSNTSVERTSSAKHREHGNCQGGGSEGAADHRYDDGNEDDGEYADHDNDEDDEEYVDNDDGEKEEDDDANKKWSGQVLDQTQPEDRVHIKARLVRFSWQRGVKIGGHRRFAIGIIINIIVVNHHH